MKRVLFIFACMLAMGVQNVEAQDYFSSANSFARLYVGQIEPQYNLPLWQDNPYYKESVQTWKGRVCYHGVVYDNVNLRFDMYKQNLVVVAPVSDMYCLPEQKYVDWFEVDGHRYVHDPEDSTRYAAFNPMPVPEA